MSKFFGRTIDATQGSITKGIITYAIPVVFSTLIQGCFNAVDILVLGNMADSSAVASVGATTAIAALLVNIFVGISNGANIVLAKLFGAKDSSRIQRCADTCILSALFFGLLIALVGIPLIPTFLRWTKCPADCFEGAKIYIQIYFAGAPAILLYNYGSGILKSAGDSQRPLLFIISGGLTNVVLNIILCLILSQKVAAVAIATVSSNVVAAFLVLRRLAKMEGDGHINLRKLRFSFLEFGHILRQGIPLAITSALYPISNLQIQAAINSYGVSAVAGTSTASTIDGFTNSFHTAFSATCGVFMGQNIGAKNPYRVKKSFQHCLIWGVSAGFAFGTSAFLFGRSICALFLPDDPLAIDYAMTRMTFISLFFWLNALIGVLSSANQAFGHSGFSATISIITIFLFRYFWMWCIYPMFETFASLMACYTVSWALLALLHTLGFLHFRKAYEASARNQTPAKNPI